jgi:hypothetical protein
MIAARNLAPLALSVLTLALISCGEPDSWSVEVNNTGGSGSGSGGFTGSASGVTVIAGGRAIGYADAAPSSWIPLPLGADQPELIDLWELPDPAGGASAFLSVEAAPPDEVDIGARVGALRAPEGEEPRLTAPPPWESPGGALIEQRGTLADPGSRWWIETLETEPACGLAIAILPGSELVIELIGPLAAVAAHRQAFLDLCSLRAE